MIKRIYILLATLAIISVTGCMSKKKLVYTKYYLLEPPHETQLLDEIGSKSKMKLEIGSISVSPAYAGTKIVHRNRSNEIVYYSYHEWAVLPEISITQMATEFFKSTHDFAEVSKYISDNRPDYRLDAEVSRIEMLDVDGKTNAHIIVTYSYTDAKSDELVLQDRYDERIEISQKDMNILAQSVSQLIWNSLGQLFNKMAEYHHNNN